MNLFEVQSETTEEYEPFDEEEEQKGVLPPLYICRHQAKASGCKLWYMHPKDPFPCNGPINARTPCPVCGCPGYLQKIN